MICIKDIPKLKGKKITNKYIHGIFYPYGIQHENYKAPGP